MSDLISRNALIEEIRGWQEDIHDNEYDADKFDFVFERIYEILEELPTVEANPVVHGEWIPCSERLPKPYEKVLVFTDSHTQEIWTLLKDEEDEYWEDDYGYGQLIRDAIAWMPLPHPYTEDMRKKVH